MIYPSITRKLAGVVLALACLAAPAVTVAVADERLAAQVIDGDTLVLENGDQVRLVGIQAPKLPLGRSGFQPWPLAEEARQALAELTRGRPLTLEYGGRRMDRHGRHLAHLFDAAGRWIQGEMLSRGLARVYTFADNRQHAADMLALERQARATGTGIWALPFYRVLDAAGTAGAIGTFQLVEAPVREVSLVGGRTYLNFGEDWRSDFTIVMPSPVRRQFERGGMDAAALAGRIVRVRGWLTRQNGPAIELTHPEQIELPDP